jgi:hypothetical protein
MERELTHHLGYEKYSPAGKKVSGKLTPSSQVGFDMP